MISQNLFDETLLENQDVFEYTDDEAVKETISEFIQQQSQATSTHVQDRLEHLSLTHPSSPQGKRDRDIQKRFVESLETDSQSIAVATSILRELQQVQPSVTRRNDTENEKANEGDGKSKPCNFRTQMLSLWFLVLQKNLWTKISERFVGSDDFSEFNLLIDFVVALLPDSSLSLHPLAHDLKRAIAPFWFQPNQKKEIDEDKNTGGDESTASTWCRLFEYSFAKENNNDFHYSLVHLAHNLCNGCEDNKKSFVKGSLVRCEQKRDKIGLELFVESLAIAESVEPSSFGLVRESCRLISILSKFQPLAEPNKSPCTPDTPMTGGTPLVSSAHANVKEFHKAGAVPRLHRIAKGCLHGLQQREDDSNNKEASQLTPPQLQGLLCDSLAALRTMAIDNDIVQNMIALGILDTVRESLEVLGRVANTLDLSRQPTSGLMSTTGLATATMGLVRNLCANDEVKTTICKSSLPMILQVMQRYLNDDECTQIFSQEDTKPRSRRTKANAILQEHACGILAAMALRQPQNAHDIVEGGGHLLIFDAMRAFPDKVTLQRQGCLAVRNIASRVSRMSYDEDKTKLLDAGAEDVLQNIAGKHPASAEEAYAALRDLGCNPQMFKLDEYGNTTRSMTEAFGTVKSNFRPVYE